MHFMKDTKNKPRILFFGTPHIAVTILDELKQAGIIPDLIVTAPDKPAGRKLILTPPPAKVWAENECIATFQPEKLDAEAVDAIKSEGSWDLFVVAAYGKLIPQTILDIPTHGTLNVHPSLLPKLRGASPIQSAILTEEKTGVTIMLLDADMDHGPIVAQKEVPVTPWPPRADKLEDMLAHEGGALLAEVIPQWVGGTIKAREQDHTQATFTQKITKEDGLVDLDGDPLQNFRKIQAFRVWPRTYFFAEKNGKKVRVIITDAELTDGSLIVKKVIPEGKKEMDYETFLKH